MKKRMQLRAFPAPRRSSYFATYFATYFAKATKVRKATKDR